MAAQHYPMGASRSRIGQEYKPEAKGKQHPELVTVTPCLVKHIVKQIVLYAIWAKAFPSTPLPYRLLVSWTAPLVPSLFHTDGSLLCLIRPYS